MRSTCLFRLFTCDASEEVSGSMENSLQRQSWRSMMMNQLRRTCACVLSKGKTVIRQKADTKNTKTLSLCMIMLPTWPAIAGCHTLVYWYCHNQPCRIPVGAGHVLAVLLYSRGMVLVSANQWWWNSSRHRDEYQFHLSSTYHPPVLMTTDGIWLHGTQALIFLFQWSRGNVVGGCHRSEAEAPSWGMWRQSCLWKW